MNASRTLCSRHSPKTKLLPSLVLTCGLSVCVVDAAAVVVHLDETAPSPIFPVIDSMSQQQYPDTYTYTQPSTGLGVSLGAYFEGQVVGQQTPAIPPSPPGATQESYETITGSPAPNMSLALRSQGLDRNLEVQDLSSFGLPKILGGLLDTPGESHGAVSMLFNQPIDILGMSLWGYNAGSPGTITFQFFGTLGNLIDIQTITAYDGPIWFDGAADPFSAVTITTDDYQGMGYAEFRASPVPAPTSVLLMLGGLLALMRLRRRPQRPSRTEDRIR